MDKKIRHITTEQRHRNQSFFIIIIIIINILHPRVAYRSPITIVTNHVSRFHPLALTVGVMGTEL